MGKANDDNNKNSENNIKMRIIAISAIMRRQN
jgi:hypothetical protein